MITYTPPTKRRRWPGVLLLAVVLVVFLLLISACGTNEPTLVNQQTNNEQNSGWYEITDPDTGVVLRCHDIKSHTAYDYNVNAPICYVKPAG